MEKAFLPTAALFVLFALPAAGQNAISSGAKTEGSRTQLRRMLVVQCELLEDPTLSGSLFHREFEGGRA
jgi:hypothetical protein